MVHSEGDSETFASVTTETGFSLDGAGLLTLSSTAVGASEVGGIASTVSEEAASAFAVVVIGSEGGLLGSGREDSSSPEPTAEETSGTKGNDGRNSDGMGRGAMPGKFREDKEGRGGKPGFTISGTPTPGMMCGAGRLRLGRVGRLGSPPPGNGIRPGNVVAGFIGGTEVRDWFTCGDNNGTVGMPVLRTLLTAGGAELIESPDRLCSIPVVPGGDKDGGFTEDSWTSVNPSLRGVIGVAVICPGREIFFPSSNGRVGIRCK